MTLRWAPPAQVNPTVVTVGTGFFSGTYAADEDVIFNWPVSPRTSSFNVTGGRHVRIIGGSCVKGTSGSAIVFDGLHGSAFLEGLDIDMTAISADAINVRGSGSPYSLFPDVYIQNCRLLNVNGSNAGTHADIFQAQGSIGTLYVDALTGSSNFQGLSLFQNQAPISGAYISRTNLFYYTGGDAVTYLFWNMDTGSAAPFVPVYLDRFYIAPRGGQDLSQSIHPSPGQSDSTGDDIGCFTTDSWVSAQWPAITRTFGKVISGPPPGGDFCPSGVPGVSYVSPGYDTAGIGVTIGRPSSLDSGLRLAGSLR